MEPDELDEPIEDEDNSDDQHWTEWGPYDIQPIE